jgi:hypothetical protein
MRVMANAPLHLVEALKRYDAGEPQPFNAFAANSRTSAEHGIHFV